MRKKSSTPRPSDAASNSTIGPHTSSIVQSSDGITGSLQGTNVTHSVDEIARANSETAERRPIDFVDREISQDALPTTMLTKHPLPPPKRRLAGGEEVQRAGGVIDLTDNDENAGPIAKKAKIVTGVASAQYATETAERKTHLAEAADRKSVV